MKVAEAKKKIEDMQRTCENLHKIILTFSNLENKKNQDFLNEFYEKTLINETLEQVCSKSFTILKDQIDKLENAINEAEINM